jgi:hypothetical protein
MTPGRPTSSARTARTATSRPSRPSRPSERKRTGVAKVAVAPPYYVLRVTEVSQNEPPNCQCSSHLPGSTLQDQERFKGTSVCRGSSSITFGQMAMGAFNKLTQARSTHYNTCCAGQLQSWTLEQELRNAAILNYEIGSHERDPEFLACATAAGGKCVTCPNNLGEASQFVKVSYAAGQCASSIGYCSKSDCQTAMNKYIKSSDYKHPERESRTFDSVWNPLALPDISLSTDTTAGQPAWWDII